jgi:hypothetical protein
MPEYVEDVSFNNKTKLKIAFNKFYKKIWKNLIQNVLRKEI